MRYRIEIEAATALELAQALTKLAAHVLKVGIAKPVKILAEDSAVIASRARISHKK